MRIFTLRCAAMSCLAAGILASIPRAVSAQSTPPLPQPAKTCLVDNAIPGDQRAAIEATGMGFVRAILDGRADDAYATFTTAMKSQLPAEQFAQMVAGARKSYQAVQGLHASHVYLVTDPAGGADKTVTCGAVGLPEEYVSVAVEPVALQAHLLIEGDIAGNNFTFVLWLIHDQDWQVQNIYLGMTAMIGKSAADLWRMGRQQNQRHHSFDAALLYGAADNLAERGPDLELAIRPQLRAEMAKLEPPRALQGKTTLTWHLGDRTYTILAVGPVGIRQKLYLMINWQTTSWKDDQEVEARSKRLMTDFARVFPEYADVFAGVIMSAVEKESGRGYRSYYPVEKGP
jgi:hypothetical protein